MVLLICLPLMRPLRHPDPRLISDDEQSRLATIQAVVEHHTLEIQHTAFFATRDVIRVERMDRQPHWYSDQSPVMSVLLSGPYWVMHRCGLNFDDDPILTEYLLTLLGVTLPIAFAAGLLYRMARMFELKRPYRAALALAVVIGSGWISYATVLNGGAAAAALVVMGAACLVQAGVTSRRYAALSWVTLGGLCAALAATYEIAAVAFLLLLLLVVAGLRWSLRARFAGISLYAVGASVPLLLFAGLNRPITGDLRPGFLHPELSVAAVMKPDGRVFSMRSRLADEEDDPPAFWRRAWRGVARFASSIFGEHGLLTHFPVLILGVLGVSMVMRRHWPVTIKVMACATMVAAVGIMIGYTVIQADWRDAMFANRWFLVFLPLILFWAGAWIRRTHRPVTWAIAGGLWCVSAGIALLGATDPQPRQGYDSYTAAGAWIHLVQPATPPAERDLIAAREFGARAFP